METDVIERVARAWASMDGNSEAYERDKALDYGDSEYCGHDEGYMADAEELLRRAGVLDT